jgi:hypothetical protein
LADQQFLISFIFNFPSIETSFDHPNYIIFKSSMQHTLKRIDSI